MMPRTTCFALLFATTAFALTACDPVILAGGSGGGGGEGGDTGTPTRTDTGTTISGTDTGTDTGTQTGTTTWTDTGTQTGSTTWTDTGTQTGTTTWTQTVGYECSAAGGVCVLNVPDVWCVYGVMGNPAEYPCGLGDVACCLPMACAPGFDQMCNQDPSYNGLAGQCNDGLCECLPSHEKQPSGKCL